MKLLYSWPMRLPSSHFLVPLLPAALAWLAVSSDARAQAQTDTPAAPLPALPEAAPAAPPPPSAAPATPPPPPTSLPPAPPPVGATPAAPASGGGAEPVGFYVTRYRHDGFYLSVNTGIGVLSAWGSGPLGSASISGFASGGALAIGGTIAPGLVLGGVVREWSTTGTFNGGPVVTGTTTTYFANGMATPSHPTLTGNTHVASFEFGAFLDWYPNPEKGWHAGASLGLGGMTLIDDAGTRSVSGAVGGSLFGGYQWWLGPAWSLGIAGVVSSATAGRFDDSNHDDTGYKLTPLGIGIEADLLFYLIVAQRHDGQHRADDVRSPTGGVVRGRPRTSADRPKRRGRSPFAQGPPFESLACSRFGVIVERFRRREGRGARRLGAAWRMLWNRLPRRFHRGATGPCTPSSSVSSVPITARYA